MDESAGDITNLFSPSPDLRNHEIEGKNRNPSFGLSLGRI